MNRDELIAKAKEAYAKTQGGMSLSPDESCQEWILEFAALITEPLEAEIADFKSVLNNKAKKWVMQEDEIAELQAHINRLLKHIKEDIYQPDNSSSLTRSGNSYCTDCGSLIGDGHLPKCILFTTPTQSLKAHDDELIDKCVQAIINVGGKRVWEFVDAVKSVA